MPINTQEHTSKHFDAELETVRSRVLQMGGLVEKQITAAIEALTTGNLQLAEQTIANDHRVNALEVGSTRTAPTSSPAASRPRRTCA